MLTQEKNLSSPLTLGDVEKVLITQESSSDYSRTPTSSKPTAKKAKRTYGCTDLGKAKTELAISTKEHSQEKHTIEMQKYELEIKILTVQLQKEEAQLEKELLQVKKEQLLIQLLKKVTKITVFLVFF